MSTDIVRRSPQQELVAQLRGDTFREQLTMALPPSVTPGHFVRIASTAILTNPDIANLERESVLRALMQCAADGLMPDGKEAAITPRKGKAAYVPMIGGFRKKAAEHGWTLRTAVVYENDDFDHAVVDGEEVITHRPVRPGAERGDLIASYAIAKHRDGRKLMTVLHPADIAKRRKSSSYDAVWNEHPAAMWEKSAGRDLFGQLGLAEGDAAIQRMLAVDDLENGDAANKLYGPDRAQISSGDDPTRAADARPDGSAERPEERQQAVPSPQPSQTSATGDETAPGEFVDPDEIEFGEQADDAVVAAAREAASFVIPKGRLAGKTLQEAFDAGETQWFQGALSKVTTPGYREAVHAFCRVYLPDDYARIVEGQS